MSSGRSSGQLDQIDAVTELPQLRVPPGNRWHAWSEDLSGYHAIRVNDQDRIIFRFAGHDAHDVRSTDYH
jgi:proteic killer suppression protein